MCWTSVVNGTFCETQGQLARALGCDVTDLILWREEDGTAMYAASALEAEYCLCPVDDDATAAAFGYCAEHDGRGNAVYHKIAS